MKKLLNLILIAVLIFSLAAPVFASEVGFVPSIADKGAPVIVTTVDEEANEEIIGHVVDANKEIVSTQYAGNWIFTPVSEAYDTKAIPTETANILIEAYNELSNENTSLTALCPELEEIVSISGTEVKADELVVRDMFDVSLVDGKIEELLNQDENHTITLTFELDVPKEDNLFVITKCNDEWVPAVGVVNNGDGTVSVTFEQFCPVVFLTDYVESASDEAPVVIDTIPVYNFPWIVVLVAALILVIALIIIIRKNKKETVKQ